MENPKIKACPFCGSESEIERPGTARQSMIIACTNCGGRMESGDVVGLTRPERYAWNVRAGDRKPAMSKTVGVKALASATGSAASSDWPKPNDPDFAVKLKGKCESEARRMNITMDEYLDRLACKLIFENGIPPNDRDEPLAVASKKPLE